LIFRKSSVAAARDHTLHSTAGKPALPRRNHCPVYAWLFLEDGVMALQCFRSINCAPVTYGKRPPKKSQGDQLEHTPRLRRSSPNLRAYCCQGCEAETASSGSIDLTAKTLTPYAPTPIANRIPHTVANEVCSRMHVPPSFLIPTRAQTAGASSLETARTQSRPNGPLALDGAADRKQDAIGFPLGYHRGD
jgi:hypothetical protein